MVQIWEKVAGTNLVSCSTWCWQQATTNWPTSLYYRSPRSNHREISRSIFFSGILDDIVEHFSCRPCVIHRASRIVFPHPPTIKSFLGFQNWGFDVSPSTHTHHQPESFRLYFWVRLPELGFPGATPPLVPPSPPPNFLLTLSFWVGVPELSEQSVVCESHYFSAFGIGGGGEGVTWKIRFVWLCTSKRGGKLAGITSVCWPCGWLPGFQVSRIPRCLWFLGYSPPLLTNWEGWLPVRFALEPVGSLYCTHFKCTQNSPEIYKKNEKSDIRTPNYT